MTSDYSTPTRSIRDGFGDGLLAAGQVNKKIMAVSADLDETLRLAKFKAAFPDRFVQAGVAEQNMAGVAAGLALAGEIPFITSFAAFSPGRNWDQIRVSICYSDLNVKIIGQAGLTIGEDGATHQAMEDLAITRVLPNMTVVVPCDYTQAYQATQAIATHVGPTYLRLARPNVLDVITTDLPFEIGKAQVLRPGNDATIFATGLMVQPALAAAELLSISGTSAQVINMHTIKPIDRLAICQAANQSGVFVSAEEHQLFGGLGSAISEVVMQETGKGIRVPVVLEMVGIPDRFGESAQAGDLLEKYQLTAEHIVAAVEKALARRQRLGSY
jgi:transketolase